MSYRAPIKDILFSLEEIAGLNILIETGVLKNLEKDKVCAVLEEAGEFASEKIAPLNKKGDEQGAHLVNGEVVMPDGWGEIYRDWVEAGWASLPHPKSCGGGGFPVMMAMACAEMWNSASMAFGLNLILTQAAAHALLLYGSDTLKSQYLEKLITGAWTGTMQLTELHAGSDLGMVGTAAIPQENGTFRLFGTKVFISFGDHSLTENIVHMVLARIPAAPPGNKGVSLFLVPKYLLAKDGTPSERNDIVCAKLENKLGIHGSPTAVMTLGDKVGAVGWLVGEANKGLEAGLAMMNTARLAIGVQGVAIAERAYQQALAYAQERRQGRTLGTPPGRMSPIIGHPDVRRMLLSMRAKIAAARAIYAKAASEIDLARHSKKRLEEKTKALAKANLLTPVAKAYCTDIGVEVASEALQVHGAQGYIEETGAAQHYRDARAARIYAGTNGIHAIDLLTRKLPINNGQPVRDFLRELREIVSDIQSSNLLGRMGERLGEAHSALADATEWMLSTYDAFNLSRSGRNRDNSERALASATPYCQLFGITAGGILLAKGAIAINRKAEGHADLHLATARFFAEQISTEAAGLAQVIIHGSNAILDVSVEDLRKF